MNAFWLSVLGGVARTAIASASGYAVAKGTISADDATTTLGAIAAAGTGLWSVFQKARAPDTVTAAIANNAVPEPLLPAAERTKRRQRRTM
jgi:hypothetical protein